MALTKEERARASQAAKNAFYAAEKASKEGKNINVAANRAFQSTIEDSAPKAWTQSVKTDPAKVTSVDVERDLVGSTKKLARANTDRTKYNVYKAQNDLDDYLKSDEYKQKRAERGQQDTTQTYAAAGEYNYTTAPVTMDEKEKKLRAALKRAEDEEAAAVERKAIADDLEAITGLSEDERKQLELFTAQSNYGTMSQSRADMTASDLFDKYGKDRVVEMSNTLRRQQNEEREQDVDAKAREFANEHGVLASAATVPVAAVSGITGTFGQLRELGRGDDRYRTLDPNARGTMGDVFTGAVRGQVGENIEESLGGGTLGKAGSIAYQGVMSAADSVARAFIGGGALGGAALAATGSFSQTMADASRNGATPAEAAILATATAGIEALSEKIPLDNLIKTAKGKNFGPALKKAFRQMGIEATTEEISLFSSIMAEAAILQEKSSYRQDIVNGVAQGLTPDEAIAQANKNIMNEALNTLLVSAVSGGISSVGGSIADALGRFADEQARNNPAVNKPKQGDVIKSKEALLQKYAQPEAQVQQPAFDVKQDKATMPETIREVIAQNEKENLWSDTVIPYRTDAIKNDPTAMKWLADRGLAEGDMQKNLDNLSAGRYQLTKPAEATTQAETAQPEIQQPEAEPAAQEPVQPQQNLSDVIAETFKTAREKNAPAPEADVQTAAQQYANVLWGKRDGNNGWSSVTDNSVWATALAMKEVNPDFYNTYMNDAEGSHSTPVIDAVVNAANDVRQESISPMAAATVINEAYVKGGEAGLRQLYNPRNGNLYASVLDQMRVVDAERNTTAQSAGDVDEFENWGTGGTNRENFMGRDWKEVGKRNVKAYMYENPEVKPYFQMEAQIMLMELADSTKGEKFYNADVAYESGGEKGRTGVKRHTSEDIAYLLDTQGFTYDQIEKGLQAIVDDNGAENNAASKRIEFILHNRLMNGHKDFYGDRETYPDGRVPASDDYVNLINEKQIHTYDIEPEASTPAMDTQTAPDTASPNQESQSADGGQQTQEPQGKPEMQRDRINAVRKQEIPVTDKDGRKVSEFVGNAYQSSLTPDSFTDSIKRLVDEGQVSYDVQTNEKSLRKGAQMIAEAGTERDAVNKIRDFASTGKFTPEHIAMGTLLYQDLTAQIDEQAKNGKVDPNLQRDAEDVFVSMQQMATNSGRSLQLFNLFRKMTPESQVRVMQKEVQRNIEKMQKAGAVKKDYKAEIDPQLTSMYRDAASEYQKAKTEEAKQAAEQKMQDIQNVIYAEEAAKLPTTFKAKWDAWRYMAMLGNVKTQIRNVAGNALMMPYTEVKRTVGSILEKGVAQDKRTKSAFVDKELLAWAKQDTASVKSVLDGSAKLGDSTGKNPLADNIKTFGDSWAGERLNELQGVINKAVSNGDMFFKNAEYARSLAGFLKARGYTAAAVQTEGAVPVEVMNEARNYAINEAMRATFNDSNKLSDALSSLRYNGDNPVMKAINMMGEGIMPFRKTPANVLMRFKDYSPVGLTQGLWNMAKNVRNGNVTAATAIDQISAGLTGTGVMMLGYALAGGINGIKLTGSGADEDEKRQGHQNYALEFSVNGEEYSFTIDWASPFNLPLFLGANLRDAWEADDTASFYTAVLNMGKGALEPMLQLSCLSSLNDLVEGVRYSEEGEGLYTIASKIATSYLTQGVPALARQATQAANETKQTTFVTAEDPVMQDIQKTIAGVGVGNPYKTDKVNAWGEKEETGTAVERIVNAFLNPGTIKKIDNSAAEQEISRLNDAGENVTPDTFAKTITYTDKSGEKHDNVRLTEEQYQTLAQTQGQTARKLLDDLVKSKNYQALDDEQKAKAINEAYAYARKTGEIAAIGKDHTGYNESWMLDVQKKGANEILRRVVTSQLGGAMSDIDNAWDKGYNEEAFIREMESAFDSYSKLGADMKKQVYEESNGTAKKYIEARTSGVSHDDFLRAAKAVAKTTGTGAVSKETGKPGVRDIDRRQAIANTTGLTEKEVDAIMKVYMADYDPTDESPETTELKYQYAREELGLSPAEYASTYRAYLDNGRKAQKISAMMELGYDRKTATALYQLYYGKMKNDLIEMYG